MGTLGLDIGGSAIKGAPVDLETGELVEERILATMEALFWPDLTIVGGGVSREAARYLAERGVRTVGVGYLSVGGSMRMASRRIRRSSGRGSG